MHLERNLKYVCLYGKLQHSRYPMFMSLHKCVLLTLLPSLHTHAPIWQIQIGTTSQLTATRVTYSIDSNEIPTYHSLSFLRQKELKNVDGYVSHFSNKILPICRETSFRMMSDVIWSIVTKLIRNTVMFSYDKSLSLWLVNEQLIGSTCTWSFGVSNTGVFTYSAQLDL